MKGEEGKREEERVRGKNIESVVATTWFSTLRSKKGKAKSGKRCGMGMKAKKIRTRVRRGRRRPEELERVKGGLVVEGCCSG